MGHVGSIAPDGHTLAYLDDLGWHVMDIETATERSLGPTGDQPASCTWIHYPPAWAADSSLFLATCELSGTTSRSIWMFDLSSLVASPITGSTGCDSPSFSPSASTVTANCWDTTGIGSLGGAVVLNLVTGERTPIAIVEGEYAYNPSWSPDGTLIALVLTHGGSGKRPASDGLYLLPASCYLDGAVCGNPQMAPLGWTETFAWSSNGETIAYGLEAGGFSLLDVRSGKKATHQSDEHAYSFHWSPSGDWLAVGGEETLTILSPTDLSQPAIAVSDWGEVIGWLAIP